jgi:hypothetical protein
VRSIDREEIVDEKFRYIILISVNRRKIFRLVINICLGGELLRHGYTENDKRTNKTDQCILSRLKAEQIHTVRNLHTERLPMQLLSTRHK